MFTEQITTELSSAQLGPLGFFKWFENHQGLQLGTYFWPVDDAPKGVIFLVHGHGIHTEHSFLKHTKPGEQVIYEGSWVEKLNQAGFFVCGIDNQSCGRSEGVAKAHRYGRMWIGWGECAMYTGNCDAVGMSLYSVDEV